MKKLSFFKRISAALARHKLITTVVVIICLGLGYYTYGKIKASNITPQYVLSAAHLGTITQTVTGSGQVTAENQLDVKSEVSGNITAINATVGQTVKKGDLIATVDPHDALVDLQNARISYAKLVEPPKQADMDSAENSVNKAYSDAFNSISGTFLDLPVIMASLKDLFYSHTGFLSDQNTTSLIPAGQQYRLAAAQSYDKIADEYATILTEYKSLSRTSSPAAITDVLEQTHDLTSHLAETLKDTQATIVFVSRTQPEYQSSSATTAANNVNSWSTEINSHVTELLSAQNTIQSSTNSLNALVRGADNLDIQSEQLSLQQKENTYSKYFIRAPFDGIIGRIPVKVYDSASGGTVIATVASNQKMTTISLNEVDAVKVKSGNKVTLTFDAISGLTVDGTVQEVDLIGTASQGVVTYNVKISLDTEDTRIRPGMSVDATIITEQKTGILVVPSAAVKGQGANTYVEILDVTAADMAAMRTNGTTNTNSRIATGTRGTFRRTMATSTMTLGQSDTISSSTPMATTSLPGSFTGNAGVDRTITISSDVAPRRQPVKVGESDDTNTEIVSGLTAGERVIVRTTTGTAAGATSQTRTPTLFSSFGGGTRATGATTGGNRVITR